MMPRLRNPSLSQLLSAGSMANSASEGYGPPTAQALPIQRRKGRWSRAENKGSSKGAERTRMVRGSLIDPGDRGDVASQEREGDGCASPAGGARPTVRLVLMARE